MNISLICTDVDGTLVNDEKIIPEVTLSALKKAYKKGIKIAIVSGRSAVSTKKYMNDIGIVGAVSSMGGCVLQEPNGKIIKEYFFTEEDSVSIIEFAHSLKLCALLDIGEDFFVEESCKEAAEKELKMTGCEGTYIDDAKEFVKERIPNKIAILSQDHESLVSLENMVYNKGCAVDCSYSSPTILELTPKQAGKARAVYDLCEYYGCKPENTMVFGDYTNDIPMFQTESFAVAMANALPEVKKAADYVCTKTNNEGGIAEALYKFGVIS